MTTLTGNELYGHLDHLNEEVQNLKFVYDEEDPRYDWHNQMQRIIKAEKTFLQKIHKDHATLSFSGNGMPTIESLKPDLEAMIELSDENEDFKHIAETYNTEPQQNNGNYKEMHEKEWRNHLKANSKKLISKIFFDITETKDGKLELNTIKAIHIDSIDESSKRHPIAMVQGKTTYQIAWAKLFSESKQRFFGISNDLVPSNKALEKKTPSNLALKENFGNGVKINHKGDHYEQYTCRDDLFARICNSDNNFCGLIFRKSFRNTHEDYEQFKLLAERLEQISGEKIPHSRGHFKDYVSYKGLEQSILEGKAHIRIALKDKKGLLSSTAEDWLYRPRLWLGGISNALLYAGSILLLAATNHPKVALAVAICYPISQFTVIPLPIVTETLGLPSWIIRKRKLKNPNYMLKKFMKNSQRLDEMGTGVGEQRKYDKQSEKTDKYFKIYREMFNSAAILQKGFSITYEGPNRSDVINFFDYVLEDGNFPKLNKINK